MQRYENSVLYQGPQCLRVAPGAEIYVYEAGTLTLASIYETNDHVPLVNPTKADAQGTFFFYAEDGSYDIRAVSPGRPEQWSKDVILQDLVSGGALVHQEDIQVKGGLIAPAAGWEDVPSVGQPNGDGPLNAQAVALAARTSALKYKTDQIVSVRDYITTPIDGVTSNQEGIVAAVAAAQALGATLDWPDGAYVSTANIPSLHLVRHTGRGRIIRGSDVFYVCPVEGNENRIYVRETGASPNLDGITAAQPRTVASVYDVLLNYGPVLAGTWRIVLRAGTYVDGFSTRLRLGPNSENDAVASGAPQAYRTITCNNYLIIEGPDVEYDPVTNPRPTPLAVFDGGGASTVAFNFRQGVRAYVKNIKFQNYNGSQSAGGIAITEGFLRTENVHTSGCSVGIAGLRSWLQVKGGWLYGSPGKTGTGISSIFHNKHDIGSQDAGSVGRGPLISYCAWGLQAQELATGHSDYVEYEDNSIAILCTVNARVNANGSSFKRNEVAISSRFGGVVYVPSNVQLHTGTADANMDNFRRNGGQILLDSDNEVYFQDYETVYLDTSSHAITGSTTTQLACSYPVAANLLTSNPNNIYKGKALRIRASGVIAGTGGNKTFFLRIGPANVLLAGVVAQAGTSGSFAIDASVYLTGPNSQKTIIQATFSSGTQSGSAGYNTSSFVSASPDPVALSLFVQLANAADSVTVETFEVEMMG